MREGFRGYYRARSCRSNPWKNLDWYSKVHRSRISYQNRSITVAPGLARSKMLPVEQFEGAFQSIGKKTLENKVESKERGGRFHLSSLGLI